MSRWVTGWVDNWEDDGALRRRHNERDGVSNHQPNKCLLNRLLWKQIKENINAPRHLPLWEEVTGDRWIPRTKASNEENVSILSWSSWYVAFVANTLAVMQVPAYFVKSMQLL